jgi:hypothetical protein
MNNTQLMSLLRTFLQMVGTFVTSHSLLGVETAKWWELIAGIIIMVAPTIWSMYAHTDTAMIENVTAMPDVAKIIPTARANPESAIVAIAADPAQPKVVTQ